MHVLANTSASRYWFHEWIILLRVTTE